MFESESGDELAMAVVELLVRVQLLGNEDFQQVVDLQKFEKGLFINYVTQTRKGIVKILNIYTMFSLLVTIICYPCI